MVTLTGLRELLSAITDVKSGMFLSLRMSKVNKQLLYLVSIYSRYAIKLTLMLFILASLHLMKWYLSQVISLPLISTCAYINNDYATIYWYLIVKPTSLIAHWLLYVIIFTVWKCEAPIHKLSGLSATTQKSLMSETQLSFYYYINMDSDFKAVAGRSSTKEGHKET